MAVYNSIHTGDVIDNFNIRITTNTNNITTLTNQKANKCITLQPTLLVTNWNNYSLTISSNNYIATGYVYIVAPSPADRKIYASAGVYADNITTDGQITFHCDFIPSANITFNIVRMEVNP